MQDAEILRRIKNVEMTMMAHLLMAENLQGNPPHTPSQYQEPIRHRWAYVGDTISISLPPTHAYKWNDDLPLPLHWHFVLQETSHSSRHSQHNERRGTQNRDNTTTNVRGNRDSDKLQGKNRAHTATGSMNTDQESGKKWSSAVTELETGSTFITGSSGNQLHIIII